MRYFFSFLLIFFSCCALFSQDVFSIEIISRDLDTRQALPFVSVQIVDGPSGATDVDGSWKVSLPLGEYTVLGSAIGYENVSTTLTVKGNRVFTLPLKETSATLETVTVSANDARERQSRPLMGVERLSVKELEALPAALGEVDVLRGLQTISGVSSVGEASNGLSVRGGTTDQNLMLLDGAPIFTPTHLFGLFSIFTPDALGGVDLYRGNIPSQYGGRLASVIDVRSKAPSEDRFTLRGGLGLISSYLTVDTPLTKDKRLKILAGGRVSFSDFLFDFVEQLKDTRSRFGDFTSKLRYTPTEKDVLTLSTFYSKDFYAINLINNFSGVSAASNQYDYFTFNNTLDWLRIINDEVSVSTRLVVADHQPKILLPQETEDATIVYSSRIQQRSLQSTLDWKLGAKHHLAGGLQLVQNRITPGLLDPAGSTSVLRQELDDEAALETSIYINDDWSISEKLRLSLGLRYTQFHQLAPGTVRTYAGEEPPSASTLVLVDNPGSGIINTYDGLEPRLGASLELSPSTNVKASYAITRQYLHNIFNSTTPLPTSRWKVADNNVGPQQARIASLGLYQLIRKGAYEINLEGYHRQIDDLIEYRPGADFFLTPDVETDLLRGEGEAYGVELSIKDNFGAVTGQLNYSYARVRNRVDGPTFGTRINRGDWYNGYFDQPHTLNASISAKNGVANTFNLSFTLQSNRPFSAPNGYVVANGLSVPLFLERNNARLPTYHRLDFSWRIHNPAMKQKRWTGDWIFTVYNIYGRKNTINTYYVPVTSRLVNGNISTSPLQSFRLSIFAAPVLSLTYSFKFQ